MEENVFEEFKIFYTCKFCGQTNKFEDWVKKTQEMKKTEETMEKAQKKRLEVPAKISLTEYGGVKVSFILPQNYLRKVMHLEPLPKEKLPKREKK